MRFAVNFALLSGLWFVASLPSLQAQPAMPQGTVQAFDISGTVTLFDEATNTSELLTPGRQFGEGSAVETAAGASVTLLFSNGSSIVLEESSKLSITRYLQDKIPEGTQGIDALKEEPSRSETRLLLNYGDLLGETKKLNKRSKFVVNTPGGSAGIRGTRFKVKFSFRPDGTFRLEVINISSPIPSAITITVFHTPKQFEQSVQGQQPAGTQATPIQQGTVLEFNAETDSSGQVSRNAQGGLNATQLTTQLTPSQTQNLVQKLDRAVTRAIAQLERLAPPPPPPPTDPDPDPDPDPPPEPTSKTDRTIFDPSVTGGGG